MIYKKHIMNHMRPILNLNLFFSYCLFVFLSFLCSFICAFLITQYAHTHAIVEKEKKGTFFMIVEIVIIDAILFRYILMLLCVEL